MTFQLLDNVLPFLVAFFAVVALGLGLAVHGVAELVREQRAGARRRAALTPQRGVRGRLALHH